MLKTPLNRKGNNFKVKAEIAIDAGTVFPLPALPEMLTSTTKSARGFKSELLSRTQPRLGS